MKGGAQARALSKSMHIQCSWKIGYQVGHNKTEHVGPGVADDGHGHLGLEG